MPAAITDNGAAANGSRRRRRTTRWWLAGLLVGCLLPASLAQVESWRPLDRVTQVSMLAPALLRVRYRRYARRRALVRWFRRTVCWPRVGARALTYAPLVPCLPVAAHDVLTRRGPPCRR
ncbi:MAG: hypothetical protein ACQEUN_07100 [Pseudomonadota bacterium]